MCTLIVLRILVPYHLSGTRISRVLVIRLSGVILRDHIKGPFLDKVLESTLITRMSRYPTEWVKGE